MTYMIFQSKCNTVADLSRQISNSLQCNFSQCNWWRCPTGDNQIVTPATKATKSGGEG